MKPLLILIIALSLFSVSFAAEENVVSSTAQVKGYSDYEGSVINSYVCDRIIDSDCLMPIHLIPNSPGLHFALWANISQVYGRHYIVSDTAGTAVFYEYYESYLPGQTIQQFNVAASLPNGDYSFITIAVGWDGSIIVSHPYRFSVR